MTISHVTEDGWQCIDITIKNTGNYAVLLMDGSSVYGDGRFADTPGQSYITFHLSTPNGSMASDRRYFADKPQVRRSMIQILPGATYKIGYEMFNYDGFIGTFPCNPVAWHTLTGTLHVKYMVRNGMNTFQTADVVSNAVGPNNTPPYDAGSRRDGGNTQSGGRFDSSTGGTRQP